MSSDRLAVTGNGRDLVIETAGVWKHYGLGPAVRTSLRRLVNLPDNDHGPWALQDVSVAVERGRSIGILGRNGAGKSSLLKVLAGVTRPSRGAVAVRGKLFPMIELNAGMHVELTGRENVRLLGAVMGFGTREIERRMPDFEAFCELGEWFERPVRTYSSGMLARLGFAVAVNVDADILLIDEVLAVGDLAFQHKCYEALWRRKKEGATLVFVSHNLRQVEQICDEAIWLDGGRVVGRGPAAEVCAAYARASRRTIETRAGAAEPGAGGHFECLPTIKDVSVSLAGADGTSVLRCGDPVEVTISFATEAAIAAPLAEVKFYSAEMIPISSLKDVNTARGDVAPGRVGFTCRIPSLPLMPGVYALGVIVRAGTGARLITGDRVLWFEVVDPTYSVERTSTGIVYLDGSWSRSATGDGG